MLHTWQIPRAEVSPVRFTIRSRRTGRLPGRLSSTISPLHVCWSNFSRRYSAAACGCLISCWEVKNLRWHLAQFRCFEENAVFQQPQAITRFENWLLVSALRRYFNKNLRRRATNRIVQPSL